MSNSLYERACNILGVAPGADLAVIQDQYRFLAFVFHPDRIPSGTMRARVERQLKEINNARDYLVKYHAELTPVKSAPASKAKEPDVAKPAKTSPHKKPQGSGGQPDQTAAGQKEKSAAPFNPPPTGGESKSSTSTAGGESSKSSSSSSSSSNQGRWWQPPPGYGGTKTGWRRGVSGFWEDGEWHASKSSEPGPAPKKAQPGRTTYKGVNGGYWADGEWHPNKKTTD